MYIMSVGQCLACSKCTRNVSFLSCYQEIKAHVKNQGDCSTKYVVFQGQRGGVWSQGRKTRDTWGRFCQGLRVLLGLGGMPPQFSFGLGTNQLCLLLTQTEMRKVPSKMLVPSKLPHYSVMLNVDLDFRSQVKKLALFVSYLQCFLVSSPFLGMSYSKQGQKQFFTFQSNTTVPVATELRIPGRSGGRGSTGRGLKKRLRNDLEYWPFSIRAVFLLPRESNHILPEGCPESQNLAGLGIPWSVPKGHLKKIFILYWSIVD